MQGVWFRHNTQLQSLEHGQSRSLIHSLGAQDALEMAQVLDLEEAAFLIANHHIIDVEESLDLLRLSRPLELEVHIMVPLDPSAIQLAARIGCASLGIQVSLPPHEDGIQRPGLLKHLLKPLTMPVWGFGGLQASHLNGLRDIGFSGCVLDFEVAHLVDDAHLLTWP